MAAIDCGTNSLRLLVADVNDAGVLRDVVRRLEVVRLGQGVDRTGRLAPAALARTRTVLRDYAALIREHDTAAVRMVATSATRDADNRDEFVALVQAELGVDPDVVTGVAEAELSFAGAASVLGDADRALLVADIGGGSTELVRGGDGGLRAHSMTVGCVRLTERHLHDDPPRPEQVAAVVADVRAALDVARADVPLTEPATLVGVAGTVTTVAAIALAHDRYDPGAIHGASITRDQVHEVTERLLAMPRGERAALPVMHPGRVDVIAAGALVLRTLVDEIGADRLVASEHDILDGIALGLARR
ncbi:Ppx/GppA phosphatase [Jatrophihabitans endophyticus]|uniref:Ppx/GppA phosphatase n=1 Tax=Jatrophihabitans endophyticus TaxID=1206085 RepID=A0A1M5SNS8_9ACTN|nr:Ppx/GppA phosphatase [Jatrophihabitans endophyticus]